MDLPPGLEQKIRVCNATYTVRFGVRLRGEINTPSTHNLKVIGSNPTPATNNKFINTMAYEIQRHHALLSQIEFAPAFQQP